MNERKTLQLAQAFALAARGVTGDRVPLAKTLSEEVLPASIESAVREEMKEKAKKAKKAGLFGSLGQAAGTIGAGLLAPVTGGASLALAAGAGALGGGIGRVAGEAIGGNKDPFDKFGRAALEGGASAGIGGLGDIFGKAATSAAQPIGANSQGIPGLIGGASSYTKAATPSLMSKIGQGLGKLGEGAANFQQSGLGQFFQRPEFNALAEAYNQEQAYESPKTPSTFGMNTQQVQNLAREQQQAAQFDQAQRFDRKKFATQTAMQLEGLKQEMKIAKDHAALTRDLATLRETGDDRRLSESFKQDLEKLDKTLSSREKELQSGREFDAGQAELDRAADLRGRAISAGGREAKDPLEAFRNSYAKIATSNYGVVDPQQLKELAILHPEAASIVDQLLQSRPQAAGGPVPGAGGQFTLPGGGTATVRTPGVGTASAPAPTDDSRRFVRPGSAATELNRGIVQGLGLDERIQNRRGVSLDQQRKELEEKIAEEKRYRLMQQIKGEKLVEGGLGNIFRSGY